MAKGADSEARLEGWGAGVAAEAGKEGEVVVMESEETVADDRRR